MMARIHGLCRQIGHATPVPDVAGGSTAHRVTVSIGVAKWPDDGAAPETVLATADARLYEPKRLGRDRAAGPPVAWEPVPLRDVTPHRGR